MPDEDNGAELSSPLEKQEMNEYYLLLLPGEIHHRLHLTQHSGTYSYSSLAEREPNSLSCQYHSCLVN